MSNYRHTKNIIFFLIHINHAYIYMHTLHELQFQNHPALFVTKRIEIMQKNCGNDKVDNKFLFFG